MQLIGTCRRNIHRAKAWIKAEEQREARQRKAEEARRARQGVVELVS